MHKLVLNKYLYHHHYHLQFGWRTATAGFKQDKDIIKIEFQKDSFHSQGEDIVRAR